MASGKITIMGMELMAKPDSSHNAISGDGAI